MKTDVSIIIVNFNTKVLTLKCIKSVQNEGVKTKKEIIVVDNASNDESIEAIEKLVNRYSQIKIIKNKDNVGFSKANNQGIKIAKGKYIFLLNSDTKVKKGTIKELLRFAKANKDIGVVGARLLNSDNSIQESCFNFPTILGAVREYWLGQKNSFSKYAPTGKNPVEVDVVVGAAFLITPKAKKEAGFLDERYFMYFEDIDYCRRVRKLGFKILYLPSSEVVHYHGVSGKKFEDKGVQTKRLSLSSKIYHGVLKHYVINFVLWSGQKWKQLLKR